MKLKGAVALTGGIACGKSEVAGILIAQGVPVLDTDDVAHLLLAPGHWVYEKVIQTFGKEYLNAEKAIDRRKLGNLVFRDPDARRSLNEIMHPVIYDEVFQWLSGKLSGQRHAVAMIPLLYETGEESRFEKVLVVACEEKLALQRMSARGLTTEEARARIKAQMPVADKIARADAVIWNNDDLNALKKTTLEIWNNTILGKE